MAWLIVTGLFTWSQLTAPDSPCCCGKEVADGLVQRRPRREDAHAGDLQRQVVLVGRFDEAVEDRVLEELPPVGVGGVQRLVDDAAGLGIHCGATSLFGVE